MKLKNLILALMLLPLGLVAQNKVEAGLFIGQASHGGDLVEPDFFYFENSQLAFGVFARVFLSENVSLRGNLLFSRLEGDDANYSDDFFRARRNASFESPLTEFSVVAEYEPLAQKRITDDAAFKKIVSPYFFLGLGAAFINPDTDFSQSNTSGVSQDQNEDISNTQLIIPFGFGVKYDLSQNVKIGVELGARPTFTDYLDGVSISGNPDNNDWFHFLGLTLSTELGQGTKAKNDAFIQY